MMCIRTQTSRSGSRREDNPFVLHEILLHATWGPPPTIQPCPSPCWELPRYPISSSILGAKTPNFVFQKQTFKMVAKKNLIFQIFFNSSIC